MRGAYRTKPVTPVGDQQGVVVVHCSDPRYQPHFQNFLRDGLGLHHYSLLAVPGGPQTLTLIDFLPKFAWSGWRWLKFLANLATPERLVLITHDDCRWYLDNRFADPASLRARQVDDLVRVRGSFRERFGAVACEMYYARIEGSEATFERIDAQPQVRV